MRALRCLLGRHDWEHKHNPEVGGPGGGYDVCSRCGKEKPAYDAPNRSIKP